VFTESIVAGDRDFLPSVNDLVDDAELLFLFQAFPEQNSGLTLYKLEMSGNKN
jgi:hypothetical protein